MQPTGEMLREFSDGRSPAANPDAIGKQLGTLLPSLTCFSDGTAHLSQLFLSDNGVATQSPVLGDQAVHRTDKMPTGHTTQKKV